MFHNSIPLTTSQFAKLHHVNKRTLHYYDEIGLFSPLYKGDNNYRYYDYSQSIEFEYIRMLKDLHMSLEEIKVYLEHPHIDDFIEIADEKIETINQEIKKLKATKTALQKRKQMLEICPNIKDGDILIKEHHQDYVFITPTTFQTESITIFNQLKELQDISPYQESFGSFISVDKIMNHVYDDYDGLFIPTKGKKPNIMTRPSGQYLFAYSIGDWKKIPQLYEKIHHYIKVHHIELTGYAYEIGLNEIAIKHMNDYITEIMIPIKK
ncbi:MerR family transcriptional regulator [Candidatus Stoquefichus massiliensis]|uniref:MerR family transcriptional regulator n=1 Tax=Candidatus Stoquefichus massiliensis TaxID=1470350 RepID=UPI00047F732B|nr:MerR family transcriptional regulator [Candidatus Stoquefichus massiliensis]